MRNAECGTRNKGGKSLQFGIQNAECGPKATNPGKIGTWNAGLTREEEIDKEGRKAGKELGTKPRTERFPSFLFCPAFLPSL
jgi:hypothetical protein